MDATDKYYKKIMNLSKVANLIAEIAYSGNIGLHEVMKFFQVATPEEAKLFEVLMDNNQIADAWELVQKVVGTRLVGL